VLFKDDSEFPGRLQRLLDLGQRGSRLATKLRQRLHVLLEAGQRESLAQVPMRSWNSGIFAVFSLTD